MKKLILFLLLTMSIALATITLSCQQKKKSESIKIGAILPLTGNLASYGVGTRNAIELAVSQFNNHGGINGKKIELIVEDSKGEPKIAVSAANKLINNDNVQGILGPITSPEVLSIAPIVNNDKIPMISPSATSVDISSAGDYVFRTINSDVVETESFSKFVYDNLKITKIGIIGINASGTTSYANSFKKFYISLGGKITSIELLPENSNDFKNAIMKILHSGANGIYIAGYSTEIGIIIKQIREVNKSIVCLSYQSAEDDRVVELAGKSVDGLIYSSTSIPGNILGNKHEKFIKLFEDKYNKKPGVFAAEIFDGANILIQSIINSNKNSDSTVISILSNTKNYDGASGRITFDKNGDVHKPIAIYKYIGENKIPLYIFKEGKAVKF